MNKSKHGLYFLLTICLTLVIFLIFAPSYNLVNFINALFYVFLLLLVITLFIYTKKGGFFDGVTFGFRRFLSMMSNDYMEEWKEKPAPSEKVNPSFYKIMQFQTITTFVLLGLLLIIYYYI
ncbi:hypothetical protein GCM10008934_09770 [Virgibacillus salarius]|uniref:DUF3899 domain-containing protein n=1 Tax=Virgibacillus salarius TaxID=447199 RepID=UPI00047B4200|nr:DUF3899 domain-containing protein [Priestia megaterium]